MTAKDGGAVEFAISVINALMLMGSDTGSVVIRDWGDVCRRVWACFDLLDDSDKRARRRDIRRTIAMLTHVRLRYFNSRGGLTSVAVIGCREDCYSLSRTSRKLRWNWARLEITMAHAKKEDGNIAMRSLKKALAVEMAEDEAHGKEGT